MKVLFFIEFKFTKKKKRRRENSTREKDPKSQDLSLNQSENQDLSHPNLYLCEFYLFPIYLYGLLLFFFKI